MVKLRGRGKATKIPHGWHVEFSDEFMTELETAPPGTKAEVMELIKGLEEGKIDPLTMGTRMCEYCGVNNSDAPLGVNACSKCLKELQ
jgi:hypothetical protein